MADAEETRLISAALRAWCLDSGAASERIAQFFSLLVAWNTRINLTGARSIATLVDEHLPDSLAMSALIPDAARLVDVGSGGGLPAMPLAIVRPDLPIVMMEPRAKRVAFLRTAIRECALCNVEVANVRAEDSKLRGFDVAASRATLVASEWLALGRKMVRPGGRVLVFLSGQDGGASAELAEPSQTADYRVGQGRGKARRISAFDVPRETLA